MTDELERIDAVLAGIEPAQADSYLGVRLMRDSLARHREQVFDALRGALDLRLTRDERIGSEAEISLIAGVLTSLQDSIASIAQAVAGQPTARGLIPAAIKEASQLRLAAATPGSLTLRLVPVASTQEPLFEDGEESLLELSMKQLLDLLSQATGERAHLLQGIAELGPRATSHVQTLTHWLEESHAGMSLEWRSQHLRRSAQLDGPSVSQLRQVFREVQTDTRQLVMTGRLVGGSLVRGTFELEPDVEHGEPSVIAGRVDEDTLPDLERLLFGQTVVAHVEVRESRLPSGETREAYVLTRLSD